MATNALKKITTRAKQIRKKHPGKSWKVAVKDAGREYRAGKKKAPAKKRRKVSGVPAKRSPAKRKSRVGTKPKYKVVHEVRRINGITYTGGKVKVGDISNTKAVLRQQLGQRAGYIDVMISTAKTQREKNALRKQKAEVISQLNRIK